MIEGTGVEIIDVAAESPSPGEIAGWPTEAIAQHEELHIINKALGKKMTKREVTEFDLRAPEFKHPSTKLEDLEFRTDGKIVRKDRYEHGFRSLVEPAGFSLCGFEIDDVVEKVEATFRALDEIDHGYVLAILRRVETHLSITEVDAMLLHDVKDCSQVVQGFVDATVELTSEEKQ